MSPNLPTGFYQIRSAIEGNPPTGTGPVLPGSSQSIYLGAPVTTWAVVKEENVYVLGVGDYHFTGIIDRTVTAFTNFYKNVNWVITYREAQSAYTIEPADDKGKGWTVQGESIVVEYLIGQPGGDQEYLPGQLFKFEPIRN